VAEGAKGPEDCLPLDDANREGLSSYLGRFCLIFDYYTEDTIDEQR